jgi:murein DD-endopeptidase MepM/ murein hydrolase activator NlpD
MVVLGCLALMTAWTVWVFHLAMMPLESATTPNSSMHQDTVPHLTASPQVRIDSVEASSALKAQPEVVQLPPLPLESLPPALGDNVQPPQLSVRRYRDPSIGPGGASSRLMIPVDGVTPGELEDTWRRARSQGRTHDALDIIAPQGTPVVAAADGRIVKLHYSAPAGIAIYQYSRDSSMVYYYAHLDGYSEDLTEGDFVRQGDVIGSVGASGVTQSGDYHLHFAIWKPTDRTNFRKGTEINPYPLLVK